MTFPLTSSCRENLEAILAEFERAGRYYPPLYHEQLVAWSESGEVSMTDAQWQAFIDAMGIKHDDSEWSEWSGPHRASPIFSTSCLDRWYGDPNGLQEFINLAESVTAVLEREDFSSVDKVELPFSFRSWNEWISTLHAWAWRFGLPLLSCDMNLWGAEDSTLDDFYELSEQMDQTGDVSWPLHPVCWSLTFNVFTSSAAAIRAILRPENVIALNDPWPCSDGDSKLLPDGETDAAALRSCHRIVQDQIGWHVHFADSLHPLHCKFQSGLHRIAVLIRFTGKEFEATELGRYGARQEQSSRTVLRQKDLDFGNHLTLRNAEFSPQYKDDDDGRRSIEERLKVLRQERAEEDQSPDSTLRDLTLAEIDAEIRTILQQFNVDDGKVKPQRPIRDPQDKKAYDSVAKTIKDAIKELKRTAPEHLNAIKELEIQIPLPQLIFVRNEKFTPWRIELRNPGIKSGD